jgi:hypothetical protein
MVNPLSFIMASSYDSFPRCSELPTELRLKIWEYAISSPRIIELSWDSNVRSIVSMTTPPAPLRGCHES